MLYKVTPDISGVHLAPYMVVTVLLAVFSVLHYSRKALLAELGLP